MKTVVVCNNEGIMSAQLPPVGKDSRGVPMLGELVTLIPGVNLVDSKVLAKLRENPEFNKHFTNRIPPSPAPERTQEKVGKPYLELDKTIGKGGEVDDAAPLAKLPPIQCEALIAETLVEGMLRDWMKDEARPEVRRLLQDQMDKLASNPQTPATAGK